MIDPLTLIIVLAILATKTGRRAGANAIRSGYQATGWRTPSQALIHHSGRAGAWSGRLFARGTRATRRITSTLARRIYRRTERRMRKRWDRRLAGGHTPIPLIGRHRRSHPDGRDTASGGSPQPGQADRDDSTAAPTAPSAGEPTALQPATPPAEGTAPAVPSPGSGEASPPADIQPNPVPAHPPHSVRRPALSGGTVTMSKLLINIEPPTTDAEFLTDCITMAECLRTLAGEIGTWAEGVAALGLPANVTDPLTAVATGLEEAAAGAVTAATRFEEEFEEAREVAARGLAITGQDAA
ncbi:hypothetical protein Psi01_05350 [Planobispora siamensis]|uniref:Uncharacterized protein n=2 Tax=Planobispora siamensis TaxID=936338 RepID=A0A8J3SC86_9ACTN|nr:hypothetical protein Psi01_05350 [Planobispora siamensis]